MLTERDVETIRAIIRDVEAAVMGLTERRDSKLLEKQIKYIYRHPSIQNEAIINRIIHHPVSVDFFSQRKSFNYDDIKVLYRLFCFIDSLFPKKQNKERVLLEVVLTKLPKKTIEGVQIDIMFEPHYSIQDAIKIADFLLDYEAFVKEGNIYLPYGSNDTRSIDLRTSSA